MKIKLLVSTWYNLWSPCKHQAWLMWRLPDMTTFSETEGDGLLVAGSKAEQRTSYAEHGAKQPVSAFANKCADKYLFRMFLQVVYRYTGLTPSVKPDSWESFFSLRVVDSIKLSQYFGSVLLSDHLLPLWFQTGCLCSVFMHCRPTVVQ